MVSWCIPTMMMTQVSFRIWLCWTIAFMNAFVDIWSEVVLGLGGEYSVTIEGV